MPPAIVDLGALAWGAMWGSLLGLRLPTVGKSWRTVAAALASVALIAVEVYAVAGVRPAALLAGGSASAGVGLVTWRYAMRRHDRLADGAGE